MKPTRPILRYHGGKWVLAPWIISHFPNHKIYVEPYSGAYSVGIRKPRVYSEIYNDRSVEIVNLFRVVRDEGQVLREKLYLTPFSRDEFELSYQPSEDPVEQARRTVVRSFMGFGSNSLHVKSGFRANANRSNTTPANDWMNYPAFLDAIIERLRGVVIENRDAIEVIRQQDSEDTLFYVDPPYVFETRDGGKDYEFEMTNEDHANLAKELHEVKGMVLLSGYRCDLYDEMYGDWERVDRKALADGARSRVESLWINPQAQARKIQKTFFLKPKPMIKIIHGDNLDVLKTLPDNSVDSVVTDPPYGLGKEPDPIEMLLAWIDHGYLEIKGKGFMGKEWDAFVPQPIVWKEIVRVLKPGGHVFAFFGTRTYDWGVMAMRLAGFEIRDQFQWLYGSGFPKSHDISKAIDKELGMIREKTTPRAPIGQNKTRVEQGYRPNKVAQSYNDAGPVSEEANQWEGWGTAVKPANEPIVLARKPLSEKTIAKNVMKWGTGGINVNESRVKTKEVITNHSRSAESSKSKGKYGDSNAQETHQTKGQAKGRFPANVIHDGSQEVVKLFPSSAGQQGDVKGTENAPGGNCYGEYNRVPFEKNGDSGSAARFFYCAKATKKERTANGTVDNKHPTVKPVALMRYLVKMITPPGGTVLDPWIGSGTTGVACAMDGFDCIGIDMDANAIKWATGRVDYTLMKPTKKDKGDQLDIFDF